MKKGQEVFAIAPIELDWRSIEKAVVPLDTIEGLDLLFRGTVISVKPKKKAVVIKPLEVYGFIARYLPESVEVDQDSVFPEPTMAAIRYTVSLSHGVTQAIGLLTSLLGLRGMMLYNAFPSSVSNSIDNGYGPRYVVEKRSSIDEDDPWKVEMISELPELAAVAFMAGPSIEAASERRISFQVPLDYSGTTEAMMSLSFAE